MLIGLLTMREEAIDTRDSSLRFNIELLAERLELGKDALREWPDTAPLPVGYSGASTGAAAAIVAAASTPGEIMAVVSRGGRPDLAGDALRQIDAPTLLIVGGADPVVLDFNREAMQRMGKAPVEFAIVHGATHLFQEPGKLEEVAQPARDWFLRLL